MLSNSIGSMNFNVGSQGLPIQNYNQFKNQSNLNTINDLDKHHN